MLPMRALGCRVPPLLASRLATGAALTALLCLGGPAAAQTPDPQGGQQVSGERLGVHLGLPLIAIQGRSGEELEHTNVGLTGGLTVWLREEPSGARLGVGAEVAAAGEVLGFEVVQAALTFTRESAPWGDVRGWVGLGVGGLDYHDGGFCLFTPCESESWRAPTAQLGLGARTLDRHTNRRVQLGLQGRAWGYLVGEPERPLAGSVSLGLWVAPRAQPGGRRDP